MDTIDLRNSDHLEVVATGLAFPEGPVVAGDAVVVCEIAAGRLASVDRTTGATTTLASGLPGPNGAALAGPAPGGGPGGGSGDLLVVDNGGFFSWLEVDGLTIPTADAPGHTPGTLRRVDAATGATEVLAATCDGVGLVAPNDVAVDASGGVWFTDFGVHHDTPVANRPGVVYVPALGDGTYGPATGVVWGTHQANGIGLSATGDTLYVAETHSGRLWAFPVTGPGTVEGGGAPGDAHSGRLLHTAPDAMFDSLGVDPSGRVCVATIGPGGGVTCVDPATGDATRVLAPDDLTTNVCFAPTPDGGTEAWLTLSATGVLARIPDWAAVGT